MHIPAPLESASQVTRLAVLDRLLLTLGTRAICARRQMLGLSKTHLFVPDFLERPINGLLDAYRAFQRCEMPCEVTPLQVCYISPNAE